MSQNVKSISLMIAAMGCLTLTDMLIKITSKTLPIVSKMIYGIGALIVLAPLHIKREPIQLLPLTNPAVVWRNVGDQFDEQCVPRTRICSLIHNRSSDTGCTNIGHRCRSSISSRDCRSRRVLAIFIGFFGTLLIVQPGAASFNIATILVLIAAVGMALRDIATKLVRESYSSLLLSFFSCFIFIFSGSVLLVINGVFSVPDFGNFIAPAMIVTGCMGFFFMTEAVRLGEMSVVSPFRYTRLLFSLLAGILILGEQVNTIMLIGSSLTILSGLYIWHREIVLQTSK